MGKVTSLSAPVPKDLSNVETKLALNLTKRQCIFFGIAILFGLPTYFFSKDIVDSSTAALLMMAVMFPFFFMALYHKNGFRLEKILYFKIRKNIVRPKIRKYKSQNIYLKKEEIEKLRKEIEYLEGKAKRKTKSTSKDASEQKQKRKVKNNDARTDKANRSKKKAL